MVKKTDEVLIYSWVGEKNLGDELILKSIISMIRKCDKHIKMNIMGTDTKSIREIHSEFNRISTYIDGTLKSFLRAVIKYNIFKVILNILCSEKLIIACGGALSDWNPSSTLTIFFLIDIFNLMNRKICMFGIGAGPILHEESKKRFYNKLKKVDVITVRDKESYELLKSIGLKNVILSNDCVFDIASEIQKKYSVKNINDKKIAFVLAKLFDDNSCELDKYKNEVINVINSLKLLDWDIRLIPFHYSADITFLEDINKSCNVEVVNTHENINDIINCLNDQNIVVGMRYHSVVLSIILGKKVIPIIYHPKVYGVAKQFGILDLAESVGNGSNWKNSNICSERLLNNIHNLYNEPNNVQKNRDKVLKSFKNLNEKVLVKWFYSNVIVCYTVCNLIENFINN